MDHRSYFRPAGNASRSRSRSAYGRRISDSFTDIRMGFIGIGNRYKRPLKNNSTERNTQHRINEMNEVWINPDLIFLN